MMEQFLHDLGLFLYGAAAGYFFYPIYKIIKKIIYEAKLASKEWHNPPER